MHTPLLLCALIVLSAAHSMAASKVDQQTALQHSTTIEFSALLPTSDTNSLLEKEARDAEKIDDTNLENTKKVEDLGETKTKTQHKDKLTADTQHNLQRKIDTLPLEQDSLLKSHTIAIIIDDIGYNKAEGLRAIQLPGALTYAIIPGSPNAAFFATKAEQLNKEIMLHAPMSTIHHHPLGNKGLTEAMDEAQFKQTVSDAIDSLPNIRGVNNHMGSLLTQQTQPMQWLMQSLQQRQLYFIDSRTTADSVAWSVAQTANIPSLKRDIFLDHEATPAFIDQQFKQLIKIAQTQGYAVGIAHPYKVTIDYLQKHLSRLESEGIELVSASLLVKKHSPNLVAQKTTENVTQITQ